jgi:hypothetical protein
VNLAGYNVTASSISVLGELRLRGTETVSSVPDLLAGSTVSYTHTSGTNLVYSTWTYHHLHINGAGATYNAAGSLTVDGDLTISAGTLNDVGNQIVGNAGGRFNMASNTQIIIGSTTATLFPTNFVTGNVTLNEASTVTYQANATQTISTVATYGYLRLTPTITLARTYNIEGALNVARDFTINPNAASALQLTVNAYGHINVGQDYTTTIQRTGSATSRLDMRPASTDYNLTTGRLNIATSGTLDLTSAASVITLNATSGTLFTKVGTFTQGTSTVIMNPDAAVTLTSNHTITFYNLTLNPTLTASRVYTLGTQVPTINGNFLISPTAGSAATLTVNMGANITVAAGMTTTIEGSGAGPATAVLDTRPSSTDRSLTTGRLNIGTNGHLDAGGSSSVITLNATSGTLFTRTGTFTAGTSNVVVSGNGASTITSGAFTGGNAFYNLTMNPTITAGRTYTMGAGALEMNGDWTITPTAATVQTLTVNMGAAVTIATGKRLFIEGQGVGPAKVTFNTNNYALTSGQTLVGGKTITYNSGGTQNDGASTISIDVDRNIYVAGIIETNGYDWAIRKYNANGVLCDGGGACPEWGTSGMVTYNSGGTQYDDAKAITIDVDRNIYVAGIIETNGYDWAIRKYDADGVLCDGLGACVEWGTGGMVTYNSGGAQFDEAYAITIDADKNIYVAGYQGTNGDDWAVRKYNADGVLCDGVGACVEWGTGGMVTYNSGGTQQDYAFEMAIDVDRIIYVVGRHGTNGNDWAIRKYDADGVLCDGGGACPEWGTSGMVTYNSGGTQNDSAYAITIDTDKNIYVAGSQGTNGSDWAIRKYDANGVLCDGGGACAEWGTSGMVTYNSGGAQNDSAYAITIDTDKNIYVAGHQATNGHDWSIRKYDANGVLCDGGGACPNWGTSGMVTYNSEGTQYDHANEITIDVDRNIYVVGWHGFNGNDWAIRKYDAYGMHVGFRSDSIFSIGSSTITLCGTYGQGGLLSQGDSTVVFNCDQDINPLTAGAVTFNNLSLIPSITADRAYTFGPSSVTITGNFLINPEKSTGGQMTLTVNLGDDIGVATGKTTTLTGTTNALSHFDTIAGSTYAFTTGHLDMGANAAFSARNSNITINNNWTNAGTFNPGTSTVVFAGTGAQSASGLPFTFANVISSNTHSSGLTFVSSFTAQSLAVNAASLGSAATIYFAGKSTFTISTFTINGTSSYPVTLKSTDSANGNHWYLNNTSSSAVSYVQVSYSSASAGQPIYAADSVNLGDNHNWVFMADSGVRYWVASGAGNWSNPANWSVASGGPGGASVPSSTNTVIFDGAGGKNGDATLDQIVVVTTISVNGYSGTLNTNGYAVTISSAFRQNSGTVQFGASTVTVGGQFIREGGSFDAGTSTVAFTSEWPVCQLNPGGASFSSIEIKSGAYVYLTGPLIVISNLTIYGVFDLLNQNLTMTGALFNNQGYFYLSGSETLTDVVNNTDAGAWYYASNGDENIDTWTIGSDYYQLYIESSGNWWGGAQDNYQAPAGARLNVAEHFDVAAGTFSANGSTVTIGGNLLVNQYPATYIAGSGSMTVTNLYSDKIFRGGTGAIEVRNDCIIHGISGSAFTAPSGPFFIGGSLNFSSIFDFDHSNSTITFTGGQNRSLQSNNKTFHAIENLSTGTVSLVGNNLTVTNALINSAGTFFLNSRNLTMTGATLQNDGNMQLFGSETITGLTNNDVNSGTWTYVGDMDGVKETWTLKDFGTGVDYFNLVLQATTTTKDVYRITSPLSVAGNFILNQTTFSANGYPVSFAGTQAQQVGGSYIGFDNVYSSNTSSSGLTFISSFTANQFVVNTAALGNAATVYFAGNSTFTISTFTISGTSAYPVTLKSTDSANGNHWYLNNTHQNNVSYAQVSYSSASAGQTIIAYESINEGNNHNWTFATATDFGIRYWVSSTAKNWSDTSAWSLSSNGAPGAQVPLSTHTVIFDGAGGKNGDATLDQVVVVTTISVNGYSGTLNTANYALSISSYFYQNTGTVEFTASTITVRGHFIREGGSFDAGTSTVTFDGATGWSSPQYLNSGNASFHVIVSTRLSTEVHLTGSDMTITGGLSIHDPVGAWWGTMPRFDLRGKNLTMTGATLNNRGIFQLYGSETLTDVIVNSDAGTWSYAGGNNDDVVETWTILATTYFNLDINDVSDTIGNGTNDNYQLPEGSVLIVLNNFNFSGSTFSANGSTITVKNFLLPYYNPVYLASSGSMTVLGDFYLDGESFIGGAGAIDVRGDIWLDGGRFYPPTGTFSVGGNWLSDSPNYFVSGTSEVIFDGESDQTVRNVGPFYNLIKVSTTTLSVVTSSLTVTNQLNIVDGTFNLNGQNWGMTGATLINEGNIQLYGSETITGLSTNDVDSGTWTYVGDGDGVKETWTIKDFGNVDYHSLVLNVVSATKDTFRITSPLAVAGNFILNGTTFSANGYPVSFAGTQAQYVGGNYIGFDNVYSSNTSSSGLTFTSSFTANQFVVNTSVLGNSATVYFAGNSTFTISTFTITGTSAYPVTLKSTDSANSNHWYLNNTHQNNVSYAQVSFSSASAGMEIDATDGGVDLGDNHNWAFTVIAPTGTITWTGTTDTDWNTATNWDLGRTPFTGDDVVIPNTGNKPIINNQITINSLNISEGDAALDLNNYNLTVSTYITLVGTLTARGNEQIVLGGNWDNTSGWFNAANSTVTFWNGDYNWQYVKSGGTETGKQFAYLRTGVPDWQQLAFLDDDLYVRHDFRVGDWSTINNSISSVNVTIDGNLVANLGEWNLGSGTWTINGNVSGDMVTVGSEGSTLVLNGTGKTFIDSGGANYFNIVVNGSRTMGDFTSIAYTGALEVAGTLSIDTNANLSGLAGSEARVLGTGAIAGNGEFRLMNEAGLSQLDGPISVRTLKLDGEHIADLVPGTYHSSRVYFGFYSQSTVTLQSGSYVFFGTVTFRGASSQGLVMNNSVNNPTLVFYSNVNTEGAPYVDYRRGTGELVFSTSVAQTVNFAGKNIDRIVSSNTSPGGLIFSSGFNSEQLMVNAGDLNSAATVYFAGNSTFTISTFTITGTSAYPVTLKSTDSANGNHWYFNNTHQNNVSYAQVSYSSASAGVPVYAANSVDLGNNHNWMFMEDTGYRYWVASGAGNWSNPANWSVASGGPGGASVPGSTHTVIFDGAGGKNGNATLDQIVVVTTISVNGYSGTINTDDYALTISSYFYQNTGTVELMGSTVTLYGDLIRNGGIFDVGISSVSMLSDGLRYLQPYGAALHNLVIGRSPYGGGAYRTVVLTSSLVVTNSLQINPNNSSNPETRFSIRGQNIDLTGADFVNEGTLLLIGSEDIVGVVNHVESGIWIYEGGNNGLTHTIKDFGAGVDYFDLYFVLSDWNPATGDRYEIPSDLHVARDLWVFQTTVTVTASSVTIGNLLYVDDRGRYEMQASSHTVGSILPCTHARIVGGSGPLHLGELESCGLDSARFYAPSGLFTVSGNWDVGSSAIFVPGSGEVVFNGITSQSIRNVGSFYRLKSENPTSVTVVWSSLTVANQLHIASGTFNINGQNLGMTGATLLNDGNFMLRGNETITGLTNNDVDSGTWTYVGDMDGVKETWTVKDFGTGVDYFNLVLQATTTTKDVYRITSPLSVAGNFILNQTTFSANGYPVSFAGTQAQQVGGSYIGFDNVYSSNTSSSGLTFISSFTANQFVVNTAALGNAATVYFAGNSTFTISTFTISGTSAYPVTLKSTVSANGNHWYLNNTHQNNVSYAQVSYSSASAGVPVYAANSVNLGDNHNWVFMADSGVRYWVGSGAGNWSNSANWSVASGGPGGASVPSSTHTVIFDGASGKNGNATLDQIVVVTTISINGYSGTLNTDDYALSISSYFYQNTGTVEFSASTVTVSGDFIRTGGTFDAGTSTVTFNGGRLQAFDPGNGIFNAVISTETNTYVYLQGNSLTITGSLYISGLSSTINFNDPSFDLRGQNLIMTGASFYNQGNFYQFGSETLTDVVNNTDVGTWNYLGTNFDLVTDTWTIRSDFYSLVLWSRNDTEWWSVVDAQDHYQCAPGSYLNITNDFLFTRGEFYANGATVTVGGELILPWYSAKYYAGSGSMTVSNITVGVNGFYGGTGALTITDTLELGWPGVFTAPSGPFSIGGNFIAGDGQFNHSNGTVTFNGNRDQYIQSNNQSFYRLAHLSTSTLSLVENNLTVTNSLNNSSGTLFLNGRNLTLTGATFTNDANLQLYGSETITGLTNNDVNSGTWTYVGDMDGTKETWTVKDFGTGVDYFNLVLQATTTTKDVYRITSPLSVAGNFILNQTTFSANGYPVSFAGTQAQQVGGNYIGFDHVYSSNTSSSGLTFISSFTANQFVVNTAVLGNAATVYFAGNSTFTISTFTITGTSVYPVTLKSTDSANSNHWYLNNTHQNNVSYAQVSYSSASAGVPVYAANSVNLGNNHNWVFMADTGYRYWVASGAGNWSNPANWSVASGGPGGASVPSSTHTVIFDGAGGKNGNATLDQVVVVTTISVNGYSGTINTDDYALTISSYFYQNTGTVELMGSTVTLYGDLIRNGGIFDAGISSVSMLSDGSRYLQLNGAALHNLVIGRSPYGGGIYRTVVLTSSLVVTNSLQIKPYSETRFSIRGQNIDLTGADFVNEGTLLLIGSEDIVGVVNHVESGIWIYEGGNNGLTHTIKDFGAGVDYFDLYFDLSDWNPATGDRYEIPSDLHVAGDLWVFQTTVTVTASSVTIGNLLYVDDRGRYEMQASSHTVGSILPCTHARIVGGSGPLHLGELESCGLDSARFYAPSGLFTVSGNWDVGSSAIFVPGSGEVVFNGITSQSIRNVGPFYRLKSENPSSVTVVWSSLTVVNQLHIASGTFNINGQNLGMTGATLLNDGNFMLRGNETITGLTNNDVDSGTWTYVGDMDGVKETWTVKDFGTGVDYFNLVLQATTTTKDVYRITSPLSVAGNFILNQTTFSANGYPVSFAGTQAQQVGGSYIGFDNVYSSNTSSSGLTFISSFTANQFVVNTAVLGNAATVYFAGNSTFTISTFTISGTSAYPVTLKSTDSANNNHWYLNNTHQNNVSYAQVSYSSASAGQTIIAYESMNEGNNHNWTFATATDSGIRYWVSSTAKNWSDTSAWSLSSNGAPGAQVPLSTHTVIFDGAGGKNGNATLDQVVVVTTISVNGYSGTINTDDYALTISSYFYQNTGTVQFGVSTITASGDFIRHGGVFDAGTSTVVFNGTGTRYFNSGNANFSSVVISTAINSTKTLTLVGSSLTVTQALVIENIHVRLNLNGKSVGLTGAIFNNQGTIFATGEESLIDVVYDTDLGDWLFMGGNGDGVVDTWTIGTDYDGLYINLYSNHGLSGVQDVYQAAPGSMLNIKGNFTLDAGTFTANGATITVGGVFDMETYAATFNMGSGSMTVRSLWGDKTFNGGTGVLEVKDWLYYWGINTFTAPTGGIRIGGALDFESGLNFVHSNSTVTFYGSGDHTLNSAGKSFYNIEHISTTTLSLVSSNLTVTNKLTNSAGTIFLNGRNLTLTGASLENNGNIQLFGSETITGLTNNDVNSGTWTYVGNMNGTKDTWTVKDFGTGVDYFNLVLQATTTTKDVYRITSPLSVAGNFILNQTTFSANGYPVSFAGTQAQQVGGNYIGFDTVYSSNTSSGGLTFISSMTANLLQVNTNALGAAATVYFAGKSTFTISTFTINGTASYPVTLKSTDAVGGNHWFINNTSSQSVSWVQVQYSSAIGNPVIAYNSIDLGNNHNWYFPGVTAQTLVWDGSESTNWNDPKNWNLGYVPTSIDHVIIPNTGNKPIINNHVTINSLNISEGNAALDLNNYNLTVSTYITLVGTLTARGNEQISLGGNWDNTSGWFNAANSTVTINSVSGVQLLVSGGTEPGKQFSHLNYTGQARFTIGDFDVRVNRDFRFRDPTWTGVFDNTVHNRNMWIEGDLKIEDGYSNWYFGASTWTINGNLRAHLYDPPIVMHNNSTIVLTGTNKTVNFSWTDAPLYNLIVSGTYSAVSGSPIIYGLFSVPGEFYYASSMFYMTIDGDMKIPSSGKITGDSSEWTAMYFSSGSSLSQLDGELKLEEINIYGDVDLVPGTYQSPVNFMRDPSTFTALAGTYVFEDFVDYYGNNGDVYIDNSVNNPTYVFKGGFRFYEPPSIKRIFWTKGTGSIIFSTNTPQQVDFRGNSVESIISSNTSSAGLTFVSSFTTPSLIVNTAALGSAATIYFAGKSTFTISTFTITGSSAYPVTLKSTDSANGNHWYLNNTHQNNVSYAQVSYSSASAGVPVYAANSVDLGNNHNWVFMADSGIRYWVASGAGNWSNPANWSVASGGPGGASVPTATHTVVFDGGASGNGNATIDQTVVVTTISVTGYSGTLNTAGYAVTISSYFFQNSGTVQFGASTVTVQGDFIREGGGFDAGTSTVTFNGKKRQFLDIRGASLHVVQISVARTELELYRSSLTITGGLSIYYDGSAGSSNRPRLDLNGQNLAMTGATLNNESYISQIGSEVLTGVVPDLDSGTWIFKGSNGDVVVDTYTIGSQYPDVYIWANSYDLGGVQDVYRAPPGGTLDIYGDLSIDEGTFDANGATVTIKWYLTQDGYSSTYIGSSGSTTVRDAYFGYTYVGGTGAFEVIEDLSINGDFTAPTGGIRIGGDLTIWSGPFAHANSTITFSGTNDQGIDPNSFTLHYVVYTGTGTLSVRSPLIVTGGLTNNTGTVFLNGKNLTMTGATLQNEGTINLFGSETITGLSTNDVNSGTWTYVGDMDGVKETWTLKDFGSGVDYFNLVLQATTTTKDVYRITSPLSVAGNFILNQTTFSANGYPVSFAGTQAQKVGGNYIGFDNVYSSNTSSGGLTFISSFTANQFVLNTAALGSAATVYFAGNSTFTISTINFTGSADHYVTLKSTDDAVKWYLNGVSSYTAHYVYVSSSDASGSDTIYAYNSIDGGGNVNWVFMEDTGYRYWVASGAGNWSNPANWSVASGGPGGASVPSSTHTVIFDGAGGKNGDATLDQIVVVTTISVNGYSGTLNTANYALTISSAFYQNTGTVELTASTVTVSGNFIRSGGSFDAGTSTVTFTSVWPTNSINSGGGTFSSVRIYSGYIYLTGALSVNTNLTIQGTLDLLNQDLTMTGATFENQGTLALTGSENIVGMINDTDSGTWSYESRDEGATRIIKDFGPGVDYYRLFINCWYDGQRGPNEDQFHINSDLNVADYFQVDGTTVVVNASSVTAGSYTGWLGSRYYMQNSSFSISQGLSLEGHLYGGTGRIEVGNEVYCGFPSTRFELSSGGVNVGGNWDCANAANLIPGTAEVTFNGTSNQTVRNVGPFYNLTKVSTTTLSVVTSSLTVTNQLNIVDGTFNLNGQNLGMSGATLSNTGNFMLRGNETINGLTANDVDSGTWTYVGDGDGVKETWSIKDFGNVDYHNLVMNVVSATKDTFRSAAPLSITGNFIVNQTTFSANGYPISFAGTEGQQVGGSYIGFDNVYSSNTSSSGLTFISSFTANQFIVNTAALGNAATVYFAGNSTFTISTFTVNGTSSYPVTLKSTDSANGNHWYLNNTSSNAVSYVQVSYSSASAGRTIYATNSINLGNNQNWNFDETDTITWTGTIDTDWNKPGNWDKNIVPRTVDHVVIPNTGNKPIINNQITINSLNISEGECGARSQ